MRIGARTKCLRKIHHQTPLVCAHRVTLFFRSSPILLQLFNRLKRGATFFSKASQRLCGGVILDDEHVLTSPDCTLEEGKEEDLAVLYVGYHDVEQIIAKRQQIEEYEKEHGEVESLSDLFRYASRSDSEKKKVK